MVCAITVRELKPGTYDEFRKAWEPDPWLPALTHAVIFRNQDNPDLVVSIGYFEATEDQLEAIRDLPEVMREEDERLRRISEFEQQVLLNGIFTLAEEVRPPS